MYKQIILLTLICAAGVVLAACTPAGSAPDEATETPAAAPSEVPTETPTDTPAEIPAEEPVYDPKNITIVIDGQAVTLVDGIAEVPLAPGSASMQVTRYFGNEVEIDLNADGLIDTAFLVTQEGGGSGTFFYVAAAIRTADGFVGTNALFLGDRIAPQSTSIDPNNPAQFVVSYGDRAPDEPMSSPPSQMVSKTFRLEGSALVEVVE